MRDWKLESLANCKEISAVPFCTEKEAYERAPARAPRKLSNQLSNHARNQEGLQSISLADAFE